LSNAEQRAVGLIPAQSLALWQRREKMKSRKNPEQTTGKRKEQVLSMLEGIYSGVWYLGRKEEFEECTGSNWRIQKRISVRSGRYSKTRIWRRNL